MQMKAQQTNSNELNILIPNSPYLIELRIIPAESLTDGSPAPFISVKVRDTSIPARPFNALTVLDDLDFNTVTWVHCHQEDRQVLASISEFWDGSKYSYATNYTDGGPTPTTEEKAVETYQGWANYETWNVMLWINNDQGLYESIGEAEPRHGWDGPAVEAFIRDLMPAGTPDFDSAHDYEEVSWEEIATALNEDAEQEIKMKAEARAQARARAKARAPQL